MSYEPEFEKPNIMWVGGYPAVLMMLFGFFVLLYSHAAGLFLIYSGHSLFSLTCYTAYRAGEKHYLIPPERAANLFLISAVGAMVALIIWIV